MVGALRGWSHHHGEQAAASDNEAPGTPGHASYEDFPQQQPFSPSEGGSSAGGSGSPGPYKPHHHHHHSSGGGGGLHAPSLSELSAGAGGLLRSTSSVLKRLPGAQRAAALQCYLLSGCGIAAAAAAWLGAVVLLAVLLARLYLPVYEYHHTLPLFFDYSGHSAAGAYTPLLRRTPLTALLTPPAAHPSSAAAAAAAAGPLAFQGLLAPGSSLSVGGSSAWGGGGSSGSGGGFLGLGVGPAQRWRGSSSGGSSSSSSGSSGSIDVGNGVLLPEGDWLMPQHGRMRLAIDLEMPGWPEADLVQVTTEVLSQQGIVLGRSSRAWIPQQPPFVMRLARLLLLGPWQAVGLLSSNTCITLPMFEGFQNPNPPPGGWAAVRHLLHPQPQPPADAQQQQQAAWDAAAAAAASGGSAKEAPVAGPRAMWLRVTVIGRSASWGPPRIIRAAARITLHVGLLGRLAAALRPSLPTLLLLLGLCSAIAIGGAVAAAALLAAAYGLHSWGGSINPEETFSLASLDALLMGEQVIHQQQWQQQHQGGYDGSSAGGSSPRLLAGSPRAEDASSYELLQRDAGAELSRFAREEMATRGLSPASAADPFGDAAGSASYDDEDDADNDGILPRPPAGVIELQPLAQHGKAGSTSSSSLAGGAVSAIRRIFGQDSPGSSAAAAAAAAAAGSSTTGSRYSSGTAGGVQRGWGREAAVAGDTDDDSGMGPHTGAVGEWQEELLQLSEEEDEQAAVLSQRQGDPGSAGLSRRLGFPMKM